LDDDRSLSNRAAVIGVGNTAYGSFPETDEYGLAAQAFRAALEDCGLEKGDIDGLVTCRIPYYARMGEVLGINPRWSLTLPPHGRMSGIGLIEAVLALATGQAQTVGLHLAGCGPCADVPPPYGAVWHHHAPACRGVDRDPLPREPEPGCGDA